MLTTKVVSNKKPPLLSDSESGGSTSRPYGFKRGLVGDEMAGFVEFAGGKDISFSKEGYVISGVLKKSISWQQPDGTMVTLPAKTMISFINGQARY